MILSSREMRGLGFRWLFYDVWQRRRCPINIAEKYKKALFFHCSSHKQNLVVNDLKTIPEIRNTVRTIKDIITFFRESVLRRKLMPNIPSLCQTRWSEQHKSIRVLKEHFVRMMQAL